MHKEVDILLVEDSPEDAEMIIRVLSKEGFGSRLLHLEDGQEALDYLFATGAYEGQPLATYPRLILLDIKMPRLDGIEVLRTVKSNELTRSIPVVMMTSSNVEKDIRVCYGLGANSYIVKPFDFNSFNRSITELVKYWLMMNQTV